MMSNHQQPPSFQLSMAEMTMNCESCENCAKGYSELYLLILKFNSSFATDITYNHFNFGKTHP